tara:strand:- start:1037 stop:1213 length:177 start_codon:yes stop_codon:yes gene_type:complete
MDGLVTTKQLCELLSVSRQAVYKWRKSGLPVAIDNSGRGGKLIRYDWREVIEWLQERK